MRPLRLTLEGFRSYADRATFDFQGRTLVGVVGPTGAGKSTILDGLAFALYGSTPSLGAKAIKPLIHKWDQVSGDAPTVAQVELWFDVGGAIYRIQRQVKPRGPGGQKLERWDAIDGVLVETMADKVKDIATAVEGLTGLDYDGFCRAVLLAQNQFQQLLMATKKEAGDVLTGLLGFGVVERMRTITKERLDRTKGELAAAKQAKADHDALASTTAEARSGWEAAAERRDQLTAIADEVDEANTAIADFETAAAAAGEVVAAHEQGFESLPAAAEVDRVVSDATHHNQLVNAAQAAFEEATRALTAATEALDAAHGADTPARLARLGVAIDAATKAAAASARAHVELADAERRHESALVESVAADTAEQQAAVEAEKATTVEAEAARALATLEAAHAAHLLAEELSAGDPCPVCRRPVDDPPTLAEVEGLDESRRLADEARRALAAATKAHQQAIQRAQVAKAAVAHAAEGVVGARVVAETADAETATATIEVEGLVAALGGDPSDPVAALTEGQRAYEGLKAAKDSAAAGVERARQAHQRLAETDALAPLGALIERHREVAVALGIDWAAPDDPAAAGAALTALRATVEAALVAAREQAGRVADRLGSARGARATLLEQVGLGPDADFGAAASDAATKVEVAAAVLAERESQLNKAADALASVEEKHATELRLQRLHADLASGKFPQYLIDEKRRDLVASGSEWLRLLSSGRHELATLDDAFAIRDLTAAGILLSPKALSGGETFLASLALALGLATVVGLEGSTAQAFFIDEGFGSLDADSLDLALEGIERLVGDDDRRLVVVVSHVPEMRARIEDLIVLGKDEVTGATIVHRA